MIPTDDADAFEHYDDPANREPAAGEPSRLGGRTLAHVAIRFPVETIELVRPLATVSAWIRRAVDSVIRQ